MFCRKERKSKARRQLYTHTQAPNARILQNADGQKKVVVIIMIYIYSTTRLFWSFPSATYVYTHLTVQTSSCTWKYSLTSKTVFHDVNQQYIHQPCRASPHCRKRRRSTYTNSAQLNYAKRHSRSQVGDTTRRKDRKSHHPNRYKYAPPPPFSNSLGSLGLSSEPSVSTLLIAGLFCTLSGSNPGLDVRSMSQSSE